MNITIRHFCITTTLFCACINVLAQTPAKKLPLTAVQQTAIGITFTNPKATSTLPTLLTASVTTPPSKQWVISAPYAGQLNQVIVGVGDKVQPGAGLGYFTSPQMAEARQQMIEANAETQLAQQALERDQQLFNEGIIPESRLKTSQAKSNNAKAMMQARQSELRAAGVEFNDAKAKVFGYGTGLLKSPIKGMVVETYPQIGQRVEAGTLLFKVADTSELLLDINASTQKTQNIRMGDEVIVASHQAKAKVIGVNRSVDASQTAKIRATVTQRGTLQMGELVSVSIDSAQASQHPTWQVPARAVTYWKGQNIVFILNDHHAVIQPVTVVSSDDNTSTIQGTLSDTTKIAISGIASLKALAQKDE